MGVDMNDPLWLLLVVKPRKSLFFNRPRKVSRPFKGGDFANYRHLIWDIKVRKERPSQHINLATGQ
jgi:hypothetical protein